MFPLLGRALSVVMTGQDHSQECMHQCLFIELGNIEAGGVHLRHRNDMRTNSVPRTDEKIDVAFLHAASSAG
jgi:hypothetical protein